MSKAAVALLKPLSEYLAAQRNNLRAVPQNFSGEKSFSHLKQVSLKNALRSAMGHQRVADLALLNIESEVVGELDFHDIDLIDRPTNIL